MSDSGAVRCCRGTGRAGAKRTPPNVTPRCGRAASARRKPVLPLLFVRHFNTRHIVLLIPNFTPLLSPLPRSLSAAVACLPSPPRRQEQNVLNPSLRSRLMRHRQSSSVSRTIHEHNLQQLPAFVQAAAKYSFINNGLQTHHQALVCR